MSSTRARRIGRSRSFALGAWLFAVWHLFVATGVPLPAGEKDLSQPFLCMHSKCGCQNAEQCWKNCCCHTLAERLAWAKTHGVTPPAAALAAAKAKESKSPVCSLKGKRNCCDHDAALQLEQVASERYESEKNGNTVVLREALGCRGQNAQYLGIALALPPSEIFWTHEALPLEWVAIVEVVFAHIEFSPPSPPPRTAVL